MWIKICANTNLQDARLAADLGADALGFVFARSAREVTAAVAAAIESGLAAQVERIGVFGSQTSDEIVRVIEEACLTGAQLHGGLDLPLAHRLDKVLGSRITITQTLHWDTSPGASSPAETLRAQLRLIRNESPVGRVLIDSRVGSASGGTGTRFNWAAAADVLSEELGGLKLIVAGGLSPENVSEAIQSLKPWGVDVATGVESAPGKKDPKKLEAFIRKASRSISKFS